MEHVEDASDACLFVRLGGRPNLERIVYELYDPGHYLLFKKHPVVCTLKPYTPLS